MSNFSIKFHREFFHHLFLQAMFVIEIFISTQKKRYNSSSFQIFLFSECQSTKSECSCRTTKDKISNISSCENFLYWKCRIDFVRVEIQFEWEMRAFWLVGNSQNPLWLHFIYCLSYSDVGCTKKVHFKILSYKMTSEKPKKSIKNKLSKKFLILRHVFGYLIAN